MVGSRRRVRRASARRASSPRAWERARLRRDARSSSTRRPARYPLRRRSRAAYRDAAATATATAASASAEPDGRARRRRACRSTVRTRVFGDGPRRGGDAGARARSVDWAPHLVFPGLEPGRRLTRRTEAPERGHDRLGATARCWPRAPPTPAARRSAGSAASIAGHGGARARTGRAAQGAVRARLRRGHARRHDAASSACSSASSRARPAGTLLAGARVLASAEPRAGAGPCDHDRHTRPGRPP